VNQAATEALALPARVFARAVRNHYRLDATIVMSRPLFLIAGTGHPFPP
jgi:hypothetical protein